MREYIVNDKGEKTRVILDIAEYERLREIEDEMEDLEALMAARETKSAIESGGEEIISWDRAMKEIREGKVAAD